MKGKIIGGQGAFTTANMNRSSFARVDPVRGFMDPLGKNLATTIVRTDTSGIAVTNDGLYVLVGSTSTPFLRTLDTVNDNYTTPIATMPGSAANTIEMNPGGTEFTIGMAASPFIYRCSYPGFVKQADPSVVPVGAVQAQGYSGDGTRLAIAANASPWLEVYNTSTWAKVSFTPASGAPTSIPSGIAMNNDASQIAMCGIASTSRAVRVWSFPGGTTLLNDTAIRNTEDVAYSPDGTKLAALHQTTGSSWLRIYNTSTWTFVDIANPSTHFVNSNGNRKCRWIDNRYMWIDTEGTTMIIDTTTGNVVCGAENAGSSIGQGAMSPLTFARKIEGNVKNAALANVSRTVRAYHSATGFFVGEAVSDAGTGNFTMLIFTAEAVTVFAIGNAGENARIFNPVSPATL